MANLGRRHPGRPASGSLRERIRTAWSLSGPASAMPPSPEAAGGGARVRWLSTWQLAIASVFFVATAGSVVVEVFFRYVLDRPQVWSLELPTYFFFWSFSLAAGLSDWHDQQIGFPLLAEHLPWRLRLVGSAIANVLIVVPLVIVLPGTLSFLGYEAGQPNTCLPLTEVWGFAGIILFFGIAIVLRARLLVLQVRQLWRAQPDPRGWRP